MPLPKILKFCAGHSSDIAVHRVKFQNEWANEMCVIREQDFAGFVTTHNTVGTHCGAVITRSIFSQIFTKTSHTSPVRGVLCGSSIWLIFYLSSCDYLCNILHYHIKSWFLALGWPKYRRSPQQLKRFQNTSASHLIIRYAWHKNQYIFTSFRTLPHMTHVRWRQHVIDLHVLVSVGWIYQVFHLLNLSPLVPHICVSELGQIGSNWFIGSDNGVPPVRCQAII